MFEVEKKWVQEQTLKSTKEISFENWELGCSLSSNNYTNSERIKGYKHRYTHPSFGCNVSF